MQYTGELIDDKTTTEREAENQRKGITANYLFGLDFNEDSKAHYSVDATNKGNLSRFINHSCAANVRIWPAVYQYDDENKHRLYCFAQQDIPAGAELTLDYMGGVKTEGDIKPRSGNKCMCKSDKCRGSVF